MIIVVKYIMLRLARHCCVWPSFIRDSEFMMKWGKNVEWFGKSNGINKLCCLYKCLRLIVVPCFTVAEFCECQYSLQRDSVFAFLQSQKHQVKKLIVKGVFQQPINVW